VVDAIGPGSLKCVVAWPDSGDGLGQTLRDRVRDEDIRRLHDGTFLVYTDADPADIRDWLEPALGEGASAFVVEVERWSSLGPGVDSAWLLRRGH
jgi:hypothetical protein